MTDALRGHLAMLCFSGLIAGSSALGSMAAPHIAPTALNAVRFVLAAVLTPWLYNAGTFIAEVTARGTL